MKSMQSGRSLQTSCKNCTFALYEDITQIGCTAQRIEKFDKSKIIEAYDNEKEFYVINDFCNLYRSLSWNNGKQDLEKALAESALDFDVIIDCNNITQDFKKYIIESIENCLYDKNKMEITLFHDYTASSETKSIVLDIRAKFSNIKISVCVNTPIFLHETILKSRKNCHIVVHNESFNFNNFVTLNNLVNQDLKKFICAGSGDNSVIVSNMAYKMNYVNEPVDNYELNIRNLIETSKNAGMYIDI